MAPVQQLVKDLFHSSETIVLKGFTVRNYAAGDSQQWLELRHTAFAKERVGVGKWEHADFMREFLHRWWWRPEWMWLAEEPLGKKAPGIIGSITLAMRGEPDAAIPVVHWLMVHPGYRRRGIGRLLVSHLEAAAWQAGYRQLWLETHAGWQAAVRFYDALGYRPVTK